MSLVALSIEAIVALLLVGSGLFAVTGSLGLIVLRTFFHRMHPPALAYTFGAWLVTFASILYFSMLGERIELRTWIVIILFAITVPVTTVVLARAGVFRRRAAGLPLEPQRPGLL